MMNIFAYSNYGRKILFDKILSKDLEAYAFRIDAFYESVSPDQIMSVRVLKNKTVRLGINISFKEESIFSGCSEPMILSIVFRAYFIINYLYCLQAAKEEAPSSYFAGLVALDSISDLYFGKRKAICIPDIVGINKNLRPIDVHCAIRAITRLLLNNEFHITGEELKCCEEYRNTLVTYTGTPEVIYLKSKHANHTVLCEVDALKTLVLRYPNIMKECALFNQAEISTFNDLSVGKLLSFCDKNNNGFWPGLILRMFALSSGGNRLKDYKNYPCIKNAYLDFCSNSLESYVQGEEKSKLLKDNLQAVQQLARGMECFVENEVNAINGVMHYVQ